MLSFLSPWLLWGLAALALPVVAHLIHRRIRQTIKFPSLRFIQSGKIRQHGKRRPRDLPLLLMRLLILACIILALARPEWIIPADDSTQNPAAAAAERELAIVVDRSASMRGWGAWPEISSNLEAWLEENDFSSATLFFTPPLDGTTEEPGVEAASRAAILRQVTEVEPTLQPATPRTVLREVSEYTRQNAISQPHLLVISDLQATDWQDPGNAGLPRDVQLAFLPVGLAAPQRETPPANVAVTAAKTLPGGQEGRRVLVDLRNFGPREEAREILLTIGEDTWSREVTIPSGEAASEIFSVPETENTRGQVRIAPEDAYAPDDTWLFWAGSPPPVQLLAVMPDRRQAGKEEELLFLGTALGLEDSSSRFTFSVDALPAAELNADALTGKRGLLLLSSLADLNDSQLALLQEFLAQGGVALATLGESAALQARALSAGGLADVTYQRLRGANLTDSVGLFRMQPPEPGSWLEKRFEDDSARDFDLLEIYRYNALGVGENAQVIARAESGDPLLALWPVGRGQLFVSAFDFTAAWSDLPLRNAFVPLVREIFQEALPEDLGIVQVDVGQALPETVRQALSATQSANEATQGAVAGGIAQQTAVLTAGEMPVVINVARSQSFPQIMPITDLRAALLSSPTVGSQAAGAPEMRDTPPAESEGKISLWPFFATLAILLFLAEILYASWMSRELLRTAGPVAREAQAPTP